MPNSKQKLVKVKHRKNEARIKRKMQALRANSKG